MKTIKVPEGSQNGDKIRLGSQGFQKGNNSDKGSQFVTLTV